VWLEDRMSSESTTQNRSVISLKDGRQRRVGIYAKLLSEPSRSPIRKFANMFQHGSPNGERLRVIVNVACLLHVTQCGGNLVVSPSVREVLLTCTTAEFHPVFIEAAILYPVVQDDCDEYPWLDPSDDIDTEGHELSEQWFERLLLKYRVPTPKIDRYEMIVPFIRDNSATPREVLPKYLHLVQQHGIVDCYGEYFMRSDVFDALMPWLNTPLFDFTRLDVTC
jgi:hypothetical protein